MKVLKLLLVINIFVCFPISLYPQAQSDSFRIKGQISEDFNGKAIMLFTFVNDTTICQVDTSYIHNGEFAFQGQEYLIDEAIITTGNYPNPVKAMKIILERGEIEVDMCDSIPAITRGTPLNNLMRAFVDSTWIYGNANKAVWKQYESGAISKRQLWDSIGVINRESEKFYASFKKRNIHNLPGKLIFFSGLNYAEDPYFDEIYELADDELKNDYRVLQYIKYREKVLKEKAEREKIFGTQFVDFELETPEGEKKKISDFVGKNDYLYIDFWASWCAPCIRDMPELKVLNEKYKNLDILSISFDTAKANWKKAMKEIDTPWVHLTDYKGIPSDLSKAYHIEGVPYGVLVDKSGKIVYAQGNATYLAMYLEVLLAE
ncbi:TlpA disulfide reductase family protein [Dysgonomonas sp. 25]|uniref:TlpA disulfide reductase family protein n=1 Tax=Dysgonomonas sp. 25 TaxID=2302933 RepID=UPI0013D25B53|nr:TlpA disulfide reductase family protein [Dysgonomonas sp. 25]NDV67924.1 AhpC/TSA family protein [Dysgonomonas sp. 25]